MAETNTTYIPFLVVVVVVVVPQCTLASNFCKPQSTLVSAHSGSPVSPHCTTPFSPHSYIDTGARGVQTPLIPSERTVRTAPQWSKDQRHSIIRAVRKDDESERKETTR